MKNIKYNPITGDFEETLNADWEENDWKYALEANSLHWYKRYLDYPWRAGHFVG